MRIRVLSLLLLVLAVLLGACSEVTGTGDPTTAATVNGEDIAIDDVDTQVNLQRPPNSPDPEPEQLAQLQSGAVQYLVRQTLLEQGAADLGIEFTDEALQEGREALANEFGGMEALEEQLATGGFTIEDLDPQLRSQWLETEINAALAEDVEISDEEVRAEYDRRYADVPVVRHILLETPEDADDVIAELEDGADFGELARERSVDPSAQDNGGDLGPVQPGQTVPEFEDAAFAAEVGEVVGPVESQFGFHVIEVTEIQETEAPPFEEVEEPIRQEIIAQSGGQEAFLEWIRGVADEAEVEVNPRFGEWDSENIAVVPTSALDNDDSVGG